MPDLGSSIPDLGSPILDPKTEIKKEGTIIVVLTFFVTTNITKLTLFLFLNSLFTKNLSNIYPKNCHFALKNMGMGSGIQKKTYYGSRIPNSGIKKVANPRSATLAIEANSFLSFPFQESCFRPPCEGPALHLRAGHSGGPLFQCLFCGEHCPVGSGMAAFSYSIAWLSWTRTEK
jgi:hypothetical protein